MTLTCNAQHAPVRQHPEIFRQLRDAILAGAESPMTYNSPKPADILEEDKLVAKLPLGIKSVKIVKADTLFE